MASTLEGDLKRRWHEVCKALDVATADRLAADRWWQVILARYKGKNRAYHTLDHLGEMFSHYDEHVTKITDTNAVTLAIFFHDIVYDPKEGSPQNELDSAALFERFGQEALPVGDPPGRAKGELIVKVSKWIVQTSHHRCSSSDDLDCRLFMDFDMAILGKPWEEYVTYTDKIRREYIHLPEPVYWTGRKGFLEAAAAGPPIYSTDEYLGTHEEAARNNCTKEAEVLKTNLETCSSSSRMLAKVALRFKAARKVVAYLKRLRRPKFLLLFLVLLMILVRYKLFVLYMFIMGLLVFLCYIMTLLVSSRFIAYPYPEPSSRKGVVVIAGSFNPPHLGHVEMIKHLAKAHTSVHAVIGVNPSKTYEVNAYERQELLRAMIKEAGIGSGVKVVVWSGIIFHYARSIGAKIMYRGIRSWAQDGRSEKFLECQNIFYQLLSGTYRPIPTAYLQANPDLAVISSTVLRQRIANQEDISDLVPKGSAELVIQAYADKGPAKSEDAKKDD